MVYLPRVISFITVYELMAVLVAADIVFDDSSGYGRVFDGIGGLSGGGVRFLFYSFVI